MPHNWSVIALDDALDAASEVEQPWEYVSGESEGKGRTRPSSVELVAKQDWGGESLVITTRACANYAHANDACL